MTCSKSGLWMEKPVGSGQDFKICPVLTMPLYSIRTAVGLYQIVKIKTYLQANDLVAFL